MGFVRLLLATLVLTSHIRVTSGWTGVLAVECFFAISGFYVQMILREQYAGQPGWWRKFFESRFLRIFVPYWTVLLAILVLSWPHFIAGQPNVPLFPLLFSHQRDNTALYSLFSNVFILGSEQIKLMRTVDGCDSMLWEHMVIPPVWSVGIELMFYLLAPLLLTCSSGLLALLTLLTVVSKFAMYYGLSEAIFRTLPCADAVLNNFFPVELGIFTAGALGYRLYIRYLAPSAWWKQDRAYALLLAAVVVLTAGMCRGLTGSPEVQMASYQLYLIALTLLVPLLFAASRSRRLDRALGDLSYPFYLSHFYLLGLVEQYHLHKYATFALTWLITVGCSWIIVRYVEQPLSHYRHAHFRRVAGDSGLV